MTWFISFTYERNDDRGQREHATYSHDVKTDPVDHRDFTLLTTSYQRWTFSSAHVHWTENTHV